MKTLLLFIVVAIAVLSMVVAQSASGNLRYRAVELRGTLAYATAYGINDRGQIVGASHDRPMAFDPQGDTGTRATLWQADGTAVDLGVPSIPRSRASLAYDLNNNGMIVGMVSHAVASSPSLRLRSPWQQLNGVDRVLVTDYAATAYAVTDSGRVGAARGIWTLQDTIDTGPQPPSPGVSYIDTGDRLGNHQTLARYATPQTIQPKMRRLQPDGSLSLLDPLDRNAIVAATNINGLSVGAILNESSGWDLFGQSALFQNGQVQFITNPSVPHTVIDSRFIRVNDRGDALGVVTNQWTVGSSIWRSTIPFLYRDGVARTLESLIDGLSFVNVNHGALDINNRGQIVVQVGIDEDNNPATVLVYRAFRLDPIRTPGDATTDGVVNFNDLLVLAQNYGRSGNGYVFYETGDFNYDWSVDFTDLLTLAQNYRSTATGSFAGDWALAQSLVPEPTTAMTLLLASAVLVRRRR
jgi:hypothetical protein